MSGGSQKSHARSGKKHRYLVAKKKIRPRRRTNKRDHVAQRDQLIAKKHTMGGGPQKTTLKNTTV
jgi:hypothetical protein